MPRFKESDIKPKNLTATNPYGINDPEGNRRVANRTPERMEREHAQQEIAYSLSRELADHFNTDGQGRRAIEELYKKNPRAYLDLCTKLVPRVNPLQNVKSGFLELLARAHESLPPTPSQEREVNSDYLEGDYAEETGHIASARGGAVQDKGAKAQVEGVRPKETGIETDKSRRNAEVSPREYKEGHGSPEGKGKAGHSQRRRDTSAETKAKRQANLVKARAAKAAKRMAKKSS